MGSLGRKDNSAHSETELKCRLKWWAITSHFLLPEFRVLLDTQAASFPYQQSCCHLGETQCFFTSGCHQKWQPYGLLYEVSWNVETKPRKSWAVWAKGSMCRSLGTRSRTWINWWTRAVTCSICPTESAKRDVCIEWSYHPDRDSAMQTTGHLLWWRQMCG